MNICAECLTSQYLSDIIDSFGTLGWCEQHGASERKVLSTKDLAEYFIPLIELYEDLEGNRTLYAALKKDFSDSLFAGTPEVTWMRKVVKEILREAKFDPNFKTSSLTESITGGDRIVEAWNALAKELKEVNRFFIQSGPDWDTFKHVIRAHVRKITGTKSFYRGRVCDRKNWKKSEMGPPPPHAASAGRANPVGIPYLYLATDRNTVMHECRVTSNMSISIGSFVKNADAWTKRKKTHLEVVDLSSEFHMDYFMHIDVEGSAEIIKDFWKVRSLFDVLRNALSNPVSKSDSTLDYIPSQFFCEYLKNEGFDGIAYDSRLSETGVNYVFFNPTDFDCRSVETRKVKPHTLAND